LTVDTEDLNLLAIHLKYWPVKDIGGSSKRSIFIAAFQKTKDYGIDERTMYLPQCVIN